MKKLLLQLDSDRFASSFDCITAYDAEVDHVLSYGGVTLEDVRNLVYGGMFTRGGEALRILRSSSVVRRCRWVRRC